MPPRWEILENYITGQGGVGLTFNSAALAYDLGVSNWEASQMIQAHLGVQRLPYSQTLYTLYRTGRTRAAMWHVGARTADMRTMSRQYLDDIRQRVLIALEPDLARMGVLNPQAVRFSNAIVTVVDAQLQMLAASLP